ncbi:cyclopropane-fatty-acyl-phospholipid synthase [Vararia minispora EC-137]|uniref:Cyclopropane-fatty-acyl-phospholipid synthase n=1 Tax=Vararia minispora EC-137 TaxID=1314806 RepID=A0ACB8QRP3_9AGAM|nr:cyclopropane-fatty-acyl-phospholipid synthase [Vararia minispora EC-137]
MSALEQHSHSSLSSSRTGLQAFITFQHQPVNARASVLFALESAVSRGCVKIVEGSTVHCLGGVDGRCVTIEVVSPNFWTRMLSHGDLGFSEAYMAGEILIEDLPGIMNLWLDNEAGMSSNTSIFIRLTTAISGMSNAFFGQTPTNSKLNAIASYDQSNKLFKAFLDEKMMYSCALWGDEEGGPSGDLTFRNDDRSNELEAAQMRKIHHVLRTARLRPGDRLLEFGSGWGALAIEAARTYGCEVDTITLSQEQKRLADERIRAAGLQEHVRVHLMDYRELPPDFEKAFDAFVSVEMIEHVGSKYYEAYFEIVDWALKAEGATAVISSSTFPESRYTEYQAEDFMRKYMWPNSCLPSPTALINAARTGAQGRFALSSVENHSAHYPRTLREWNKRLGANLTQTLLAEDLPAVGADLSAFDAFMRKWRYFFAYAGAGFDRGYISCHMLSFVREFFFEWLLSYLLALRGKRNHARVRAGVVSVERPMENENNMG